MESLPQARANSGAAVIGGSFFLCGGRTEAEPHSRQLWTIRPPALEARRLSSMRQPRSSPALAVHGGRIYAMGKACGRSQPPQVAGMGGWVSSAPWRSMRWLPTSGAGPPPW